MDKQPEIRRACFGSVYWVRHVRGDQYMVTADGVPLGPPKSYNMAVDALDAVTGIPTKLRRVPA